MRLGQPLRYRRWLNAAASLTLPPASYDPTRRYQVQLKRTVPAVAGEPNGHILQPGSMVEVSGEFAQTIADAISAAKLLPQVD